MTKTQNIVGTILVVAIIAGVMACGSKQGELRANNNASSPSSTTPKPGQEAEAVQTDQIKAEWPKEVEFSFSGTFPENSFIKNPAVGFGRFEPVALKNGSVLFIGKSNVRFDPSVLEFHHPVWRATAQGAFDNQYGDGGFWNASKIGIAGCKNSFIEGSFFDGAKRVIAYLYCSDAPNSDQFNRFLIRFLANGDFDSSFNPLKLPSEINGIAVKYWGNNSLYVPGIGILLRAFTQKVNSWEQDKSLLLAVTEDGIINHSIGKAGWFDLSEILQTKSNPALFFNSDRRLVYAYSRLTDNSVVGTTVFVGTFDLLSGTVQPPTSFSILQGDALAFDPVVLGEDSNKKLLILHRGTIRRFIPKGANYEYDNSYGQDKFKGFNDKYYSTADASKGLAKGELKEKYHYYGDAPIRMLPSGEVLVFSNVPDYPEVGDPNQIGTKAILIDSNGLDVDSYSNIFYFPRTPVNMPGVKNISWSTVQPILVEGIKEGLDLRVVTPFTQTGNTKASWLEPDNESISHNFFHISRYKIH